MSVGMTKPNVETKLYTMKETAAQLTKIKGINNAVITEKTLERWYNKYDFGAGEVQEDGTVLFTEDDLNVIARCIEVRNFDSGPAFAVKKQLRSRLRRTVADGGIEDVTITLETATPIIEAMRTRRVASTMVGASSIVTLYDRHHGDALFTLNIRNFVGNTTTNRAILTSALLDPEDFHILNNGIAIMVKSFKILGPNRIRLEGAQVINGAESVTTLVKAAKIVRQQGKEIPQFVTAQCTTPFDPTKLWKSGEPWVRVFITEGYSEQEHDRVFRNKVIRANNVQNGVKESDFRSNDPVQIALAKWFRRTLHNGKPVVYLHKRTAGSGSAIRSEEFAKVCHAIFVDPVSFANSTSYLFDDSEKGGYCKVFGNGKTVWKTAGQKDRFTEAHFRTMCAAWFMATAFAEHLKQEKRTETDPVKKASMDRKWMFLFTAGLIMQKVYGERFREELASVYKGDWKLSKDDPIGAVFLKLYEYAKAVVHKDYSEEALKEGFGHRNWTRSRDTMNRLIGHVSAGHYDLPSLIALASVSEKTDKLN